jgi:hypothetical protein
VAQALLCDRLLLFRNRNVALLPTRTKARRKKQTGEKAEQLATLSELPAMLQKESAAMQTGMGCKADVLVVLQHAAKH